MPEFQTVFYQISWTTAKMRIIIGLLIAKFLLGIPNQTKNISNNRILVNFGFSFSQTVPLQIFRENKNVTTFFKTTINNNCNKNKNP